MTFQECDSHESSMRYRLHLKLTNRYIVYLLLLIILVTSLVVTQLFLYFDSFIGKLTFFKAGHGLPNYSQWRFPVNRDSASMGMLAGEDRLQDTKYDHLTAYHKKGQSLRDKFNCRKLFRNESSEQDKVTQFHARYANSYPVVADETVPEITEDCSKFREVRGYRSDFGSPLEMEFPLAYIILVHKDFEHLERLLRTIYMPQHFFCIHVDHKAPESLKKAVSSLARCFNNVMLASKPQDVIYAHMSRLMADIVCMRDLVQMGKTWRYLINYAATEFPLRTNLETVKILQVLHGLNDIHEQYRRRVEDRFKLEYKVVNGRMKQTQVSLAPPPYNMTIIKGQAYNTFSHEFVQWMLTDEKPRKLLEWSNKTYSPDEHYWATLNDLYHNPFLKTPGGFKGHPDKKGYITRFISWQYADAKHRCRGKSVRNICTFSALDLPVLENDMHLAANKFDLTFDPIAYACMEEFIQNRTRSQEPFNLRSYSRLYFINFKDSSS